jgi:hypothetical protein
MYWVRTPRSERLERNDGTIEMLPHFIGDGSEQAFYINNDDATSSLLPLNDDFNRCHNHLCTLRTVRTERVRTSRLDDVLPEFGNIGMPSNYPYIFWPQPSAALSADVERARFIHHDYREFGPDTVPPGVWYKSARRLLFH